MFINMNYKQNSDRVNRFIGREKHFLKFTDCCIVLFVCILMDYTVQLIPAPNVIIQILF